MSIEQEGTAFFQHVHRWAPPKESEQYNADWFNRAWLSWAGSNHKGKYTLKELNKVREYIITTILPHVQTTACLQCLLQSLSFTDCRDCMFPDIRASLRHHFKSVDSEIRLRIDDATNILQRFGHNIEIIGFNIGEDRDNFSIRMTDTGKSAWAY